MRWFVRWICSNQSNRIEYYSDYDNNGTVDTVEFYLGTVANLSSTMNPNDKPIYKELNNDTSQTALSAIVTEFNLVYYDSIGTQLSYSSLSNSSTRNSIRSLRAVIKFEAIASGDTTLYQATDLVATIRPKNLR